ITAWNSPLLMLASKLAPALAAGCTFIVKPSDPSPSSTLAFAQIFGQAGFPPGVFNVVTGSTGAIGAALVGHHGVAKVTFTGSPAVGRAVASAAGPDPEGGGPRARRQVPAGRLRRRGPGGGGQRRHRRHLRRRWPDLRRGFAP